MNKLKKEDSNRIYIMKFFAILSVVSAHSSSIRENTSILAKNLQYVLDVYGILGVGIFYFYTGFFFNENKSLKIMIIEKFNRIIIPWLFTGTIVFLYVYLRKDKMSIKEWFLWLIGYKTYLYFLTNLMIYYIFFSVIRLNKLICNILFLGSFLSIILTANNYFQILTPYLNPLNFLIYFLLGIVVKKLDLYKKIEIYSLKYIKIIFMIYMACIIGSKSFKMRITYFSNLTIIIQITGFLIMLGLSQYKIFNNKFFIQSGEKSFSIYLIHMPVAGIVTYIFNKIKYGEYCLMVRPWIIILITLNIIFFYKKIIKNKEYCLQLIGEK